ncbi:MAG TPA: thioredoxin domain-containing protein [Terriglobales bacterium]|jgi:protein-disulfide isomerase|nr:thioredoxin domain-containing protein [Terriglobales bacterium]
MATLRVPVSPYDHIQGRQDAPITLLEYADYQRPNCGLAYYIIKAVQHRFGDQLRFVFRNFSLSQTHSDAERAAEAGEFAGAHGHFWEMHDRIYENQERLSSPLLFELVDALGLSVADLQQALQKHQFLSRVENDFLGGVRSGVNGTPTFFIDGVRHDGSYTLEDLTAAIDPRLNQVRLVG